RSCSSADTATRSCFPSIFGRIPDWTSPWKPTASSARCSISPGVFHPSRRHGRRGSVVHVRKRGQSHSGHEFSKPYPPRPSERPGSREPMSPSRATTVLAAVERCRKRLWAHCYRMTGRRTEAEDLSQEAIARAIERADDLHDGAAVEGWLFRIATTGCLDHLRRQRRAPPLPDRVA